MRVLVLGATGRVGGLVVDEALNRGHTVTVLVRDTDRLGLLAMRSTVIEGDALDASAVSKAVAGQHAVIYALGAGNVRRTTLFSESTAILLGEMTRHGVTRLICVTGVGAGETKGRGGFLYDRIVYPLFTKGIYEDKDRQEALIRESPLDWTIVRPAPFREHTPSGPMMVVAGGDATLRRVGLQEVAMFLLDELDRHEHARQAVFIGHE